MGQKRSSSSRPKARSRLNLFELPPLPESEDDEAYHELHARLSRDVGVVDVIEEFWVRDLADVAWNISRLRRVQAVYLAKQVWDDVSYQATSLAEANPELMEGTEEQKTEMKALFDNTEPSLKERTAKYPTAGKKFKKFWRAAKSTLNVEVIQARNIILNLDTIEQIQHLVTIYQRRFDGVIREIDRRRFMQQQQKSIQAIDEANFKTIISKNIVPKITSEKVA